MLLGALSLLEALLLLLLLLLCTLCRASCTSCGWLRPSGGSGMGVKLTSSFSWAVATGLAGLLASGCSDTEGISEACRCCCTPVQASRQI